MSAPTTNASVVTNPGGTGTTIVPTLPTHAVGDEIRIWVVNSGTTTWSAPAGWSIRQQQASSGNASTGVIGTLLYRRVLSGDTLPLVSPTCTLGATVTRSAVAFTVRGGDLEGIHTLWEWLAFGSTAGTSNPVRPPSVTTRAPEMLVHICYGSRAATNAPEQTNYTQVQQVINSGIIVNNVSERTIADQNTVLSNQDASPTSGVRWIAMILCSPSPDYPYYRSGSQAFASNGTNVTPALPAGTSSSDNRGNKDLIVLTAQCANVAPTLNTPGDWTPLPDWSNTTSSGTTHVRKWCRLYDGSGDRQVNRTPSGEIFAYLSVYHNANQLIPTGTSATQQNASSTTSTFPALARTGTHATVQATCVADAAPTFTAPSGWTERNDSQGVTCADQSFNATDSTASASFTLSSASPTLCGLMEVFSVASVVNLILTPASASVAATTFAPKPVLALTPASGLLSVSAFAPAVSIAVMPDASSLTLTAFAPSVTIRVTVPAAILNLTTFTPGVAAIIDFPTTAVLDGFNRADGGSPPSPNWTTGVGYSNEEVVGHLVVSNQLRRQSGSTAEAESHWSARQFGPDAECYITATSLGVQELTLGVRLNNIGSGVADGYFAVIQDGDEIRIYRSEGAVHTLLAGEVTFPDIATGSKWGIRAIGDHIELWSDSGSGWELLLAAFDSTFTGAGYVGIHTISVSISTLDDFGGGTVGVAELLPASTTLTLSAFAPDVEAASGVIATPAAVSLTLASFAVRLQEVATPASGSLTLTGFAPQLVQSLTLTTASLSLTAFAPAIIANTILTPASSALSLTTSIPQLREVVTPGASSLSVTGFAPTVTITAHITVIPASTTLTTTGFSPALHERIIASTAIFILSAFAPEITISADITVAPTAQTLTLTGFAPALQLVIIPDAASLSLGTLAPTITVSADQVVTPVSTSLILTTFAPALAVGGDVAVTPAQLMLTLVVFAPVVSAGTVTTIITPAPVTLTLTSYAPWLFLGFVPAGRTFMVESGRYEVEVSAGDYEFLDSYEEDEVLVF